MRKRENGIDLLRCISFFLVVVFHSFLQNGYTAQPQTGAAMYFAGAFRWLSVCCIGLFLLQTGYLHYGKKITPSYFYPILRVWIGYVLVSMISIPVRHFLLNDPHSIAEWTRKFFAFGACNYGWYVFMYFGLMLFNPLINVTAETVKSKKLLIFICAAVTACTALPGLTSFSVIPDFWSKAYPLSYYFIGALIKKYRPRVSKRKLTAAAITIPLIMSAVTVLSTDKAFSEAEKWEFGSLPAVVLSVALFLLIYDMNVGEKAAKLCRWIGAASLEGYLLSHLLDAWVYKQIPLFRVPENYPLTFLVITVPVFLVCAFAGHYINKLAVCVYRLIIKRMEARSETAC